MSNDQNPAEWIEQYLQGELGGDQLAAFERKVATDPDFSREVDLQKNLVRHVRRAGRAELRQELKALHAELLAEEAAPVAGAPAPEPPAGVIPLRPAFRLAAAVALLLVSALLAYLLLRDPAAGPNELASKYFSPYPTLAEGPSRGAATEGSVRETAFAAYDRGDYPESIELFTQLLQNEADEVVLFYLGNAYLAAGRDEEATRTFTRYLSAYRTFRPEAQWYLALGYLRGGRTPDAQPLLNELARGGSEYREKAQRVLQELTDNP